MPPHQKTLKKIAKKLDDNSLNRITSSTVYEFNADLPVVVTDELRSMFESDLASLSTFTCKGIECIRYEDISALLTHYVEIYNGSREVELERSCSDSEYAEAHERCVTNKTNLTAARSGTENGPVTVSFDDV